MPYWAGRRHVCVLALFPKSRMWTTLVCFWHLCPPFVRVIQLDTSQTPEPRHVLSRHSLPITDLHCGCMGAQARVATASLDQTVKVRHSFKPPVRVDCYKRGIQVSGSNVCLTRGFFYLWTEGKSKEMLRSELDTFRAVACSWDKSSDLKMKRFLLVGYRSFCAVMTKYLNPNWKSCPDILQEL